MILSRLKDVCGTSREVRTPNWISRRLLLASDGMGFSLHDTIILPGTETRMWYKHHLEAVYCIEGEGQIRDESSGNVHCIEPGIVYALDRHDRHVLTAFTQMRMVCVFNPPVTGQETHDSEGAYQPASNGRSS